MTEDTNQAIANLKVACIQFQHIIIGAFKHMGDVYPVVEYDKKSNTVRFITVGGFFGTGDDLMSADQGEYLPFPDDKTLSGMLHNAFDWYHWCKDNKIK